jgi:hypothetical protein
VTPEAKQRVSRLMVGRMFDTPAEFENAPVELRNKLELVVAPLSRVQADDQWDLTPRVKDAVSILTEAWQRGMLRHPSSISIERWDVSLHAKNDPFDRLSVLPLGCTKTLEPKVWSALGSIDDLFRHSQSAAESS